MDDMSEGKFGRVHKSCCCSMSWCCVAFRTQHAAGSIYVRLRNQNDQPVLSECLKALNIENSSANDRVALYHFHVEDIKYAMNNKNVLPSKTLHKYGRGSRFNNMPPLPLASKYEIEQSAVLLKFVPPVPPPFQTEPFLEQKKRQSALVNEPEELNEVEHVQKKVAGSHLADRSTKPSYVPPRLSSTENVTSGEEEFELLL